MARYGVWPLQPPIVPIQPPGALAFTSSRLKLASIILAGGMPEPQGRGISPTRRARQCRRSRPPCTNTNAAAAPVISSCLVEDATPTQLLVTMAPGVPPMLPTSGITGLSARHDAVSWDTPTVDRTAVNQFTMTFPTAATAGQAVDVSYDQASGNITNSTPTELATTTNFACTNNVQPDALTLTQTASRCHSAEVLPPAQWLAEENLGCPGVVYGGKALLVFQLAITGDTPPAFTLQLECADNVSGSYRVGNTFAGHLVRFVDSDLFANNATIGSRLLSDPGGGSVFQVGRYVDSDSAFQPELIIVEPADTERVFSVELSPLATAADTVTCRLVFDDGTAVGSAPPSPPGLRGAGKRLLVHPWGLLGRPRAERREKGNVVVKQLHGYSPSGSSKKSITGGVRSVRTWPKKPCGTAADRRWSSTVTDVSPSKGKSMGRNTLCSPHAKTNCVPPHHGAG